ncbi:hypothetical protein CB1_000115004 [Camelus ferus]|nr:hypothetical protein CB1_000115004 [Camelus ferus]
MDHSVEAFEVPHPEKPCGTEEEGSAIILYLGSDSVHSNIFEDHSRFILPSVAAVTYLDEKLDSAAQPPPDLGFGESYVVLAGGACSVGGDENKAEGFPKPTCVRSAGEAALLGSRAHLRKSLQWSCGNATVKATPDEWGVRAKRCGIRLALARVLRDLPPEPVLSLRFLGTVFTGLKPGPWLPNAEWKGPGEEGKQPAQDEDVKKPNESKSRKQLKAAPRSLRSEGHWAASLLRAAQPPGAAASTAWNTNTDRGC